MILLFSCTTISLFPSMYNDSIKLAVNYLCCHTARESINARIIHIIMYTSHYLVTLCMIGIRFLQVYFCSFSPQTWYLFLHRYLSRSYFALRWTLHSSACENNAHVKLLWYYYMVILSDLDRLSSCIGGGMSFILYVCGV